MRDISRSPCTTIFMQEAEMDKSKITITATEEQQKILNKRWMRQESEMIIFSPASCAMRAPSFS